MKLKNKVALVTGAARGLGKAIAKRFLQEGAVVIITDLDQLNLESTAQELSPLGKIEACVMDVTQFEQVQSKMAKVVGRHGRIDILVNNAGITADAQLTKMTEEQFDCVIAVNLKGVFCCSKAVVDNMIENCYGRIVNIASVTAHNGNFGQTNYAASKAGVISMTQTWAKELGKKGITVNALAPGYVMTEMVQKVPENILDKIRGKTPVRRLGQPDEIAAACAYLVSNEAAFINGAVINIDGGLVL